MTLADLYPSGTKLVDVPPDFHGMPVAEWDRLLPSRMHAQAEKYLAAVSAEFGSDDKLKDWTKSKGRQWRGRGDWTPRDDYGSKSL